MPSPCSACHHPLRESLDKEIAHATKSKTSLAKEYGLSPSGLARHIAHSRIAAGLFLSRKAPGTGDVGPKGAKVLKHGAQGAEFASRVHAGVNLMLSGASLAQEVSRLRDRADKICTQAEEDSAEGKGMKDPRTALLAIRELTRLLELQGRMLLEASQGRASDVSSHPVWMSLSALIMGAVSKCPSCKASVMGVIRERLGVVVAQEDSEPSAVDVPFP